MCQAQFRHHLRQKAPQLQKVLQRAGKERHVKRDSELLISFMLCTLQIKGSHLWVLGLVYSGCSYYEGFFQRLEFGAVARNECGVKLMLVSKGVFRVFA